VVAAAGSVAAASVAAWVVWAARVARVARAAAYPGECAACAKSHDLTAGLQSINLSLVATLRKLHPAVSIADFPRSHAGMDGAAGGLKRRPLIVRVRMASLRGAIGQSCT
jgi:hypothetical protein